MHKAFDNEKSELGKVYTRISSCRGKISVKVATGVGNTEGTEAGLIRASLIEKGTQLAFSDSIPSQLPNSETDSATGRLAVAQLSRRIYM